MMHRVFGKLRDIFSLSRGEFRFIVRPAASICLSPRTRSFRGGVCIHFLATPILPALNSPLYTRPHGFICVPAVLPAVARLSLSSFSTTKNYFQFRDSFLSISCSSFNPLCAELFLFFPPVSSVSRLSVFFVRRPAALDNFIAGNTFGSY